MTHHTYTKPGDHHLMFADLIETVVGILNGSGMSAPQWSTDSSNMALLLSEPIQLDGREWPQWESVTDCDDHYRLTLLFPVRGGTVRASFISTHQLNTLAEVSWSPKVDPDTVFRWRRGVAHAVLP